MNANTGKRGGFTIEVPPPNETEIRAACAVIRESWGNPALRRALALPPIPDPPEILERLRYLKRGVTKWQ